MIRGKPGRSVSIAVTLWAALSVITSASAVQAQSACGSSNCPTHQNLETPRGLAMGSGQRAAAVSTSALAYNPAGLALGKLYHLEGNVDYMAELNTVALGASVVDSSTTIVGAGLSFRGFLTGNKGQSGLDGKVGLALPLGDYLAIGMAGRYVSLTQTVVAERIENDEGMYVNAEITQEIVKGFTMDASFLATPVSGLMIEVLAQNFIDLGSAYAPVLIGGSVAYGIPGTFSVGADFLTDISTFSTATFVAGGGLEYLAAGVVPLRGGYQYDTGRGVSTLTVGVGFTNETVGLELSLNQGVNGPVATRVAFGFRYHVH